MNDDEFTEWLTGLVDSWSAEMSIASRSQERIRKYIDRHVAEARKKALDEAAQICDRSEAECWHDPCCHVHDAVDIRRLADSPVREDDDESV